MFPIVFSACSDAYVALGRIGAFLTAEELGEPYAIEPESNFAVSVQGDFVWEVEETGRGEEGVPEKGKEKKDKKDKEVVALPTRTTDEGPKDVEEGEKQEKPFELRDMRFRVPKGAFVAIVGRVGSGKSSLLQAMIGEMRKQRGEVMSRTLLECVSRLLMIGWGAQVVFGGDVAYVPQNAWIMNATLRENVLFGREDDEARFQEIVTACALTQDLEMLPQGDMTEIGEKGINLRCVRWSPALRRLGLTNGVIPVSSGGQKVRARLRCPSG